MSKILEGVCMEIKVRCYCGTPCTTYHFHERRVAIFPYDFSLPLGVFPRIRMQIDLNIGIWLLFGPFRRGQIFGVTNHNVERISSIFQRQLQFALNPPGWRRPQPLALFGLELSNVNVCLFLVPQQRMEERINEVWMSHRILAAEQWVQEQGDVVFPPLSNFPNLLTPQTVEKTRFSQTKEKLSYSKLRLIDPAAY